MLGICLYRSIVHGALLAQMVAKQAELDASCLTLLLLQSTSGTHDCILAVHSAHYHVMLSGLIGLSFSNCSRDLVETETLRGRSKQQRCTMTERHKEDAYISDNKTVNATYFRKRRIYPPHVSVLVCPAK
jgi:hypothetical protein